MLTSVQSPAATYQQFESHFLIKETIWANVHLPGCDEVVLARDNRRVLRVDAVELFSIKLVNLKVYD